MISNHNRLSKYEISTYEIILSINYDFNCTTVTYILQSIYETVYHKLITMQDTKIIIN